MRDDSDQDWPSGNGEMATRIREHDWTATSVGPACGWPIELRAIVELLLANEFPMILLWGADLVQIYNDGYREIMAAKHPVGLGQPTRECWPEVWHINAPIYARAWAGETVTLNDQLFPITRHGELEEAWFTLCYGPARDRRSVVAGVFITVFETTARLRKEQAHQAALGESEERLAQAVEDGGIGHWELDLATRELKTSAHCRRNFGRPEDAPFAYDDLVASIHADDRARQQAAVAAAITAKSRFEIEYRVVTPRGETRWVEVQGQHDGNGHARLFGVSMDITARKHAETVLRQSEERLAAELAATELLRDLAERLVTEENSQRFYEEILAAAMTITRSDAGTVQLYEPASRSLVLLVINGFSPAMTDRFHRIDADSSTACGVALRINRRTFVDFDEADDEACRIHVEAGYRSAQATPLLSRDGTPLGMLNTHWHTPGHRPSAPELRFLDLLARQVADLIEARQGREALRESEAKYRTLFDSMAEGLAVCGVVRDAAGKVVDLEYIALNQALARQSGLDRNKMIGRRFTEFFTPGDFAVWMPIHAGVADTGEPAIFEQYLEALDRWYDVSVYARSGDEIAIFFRDKTAAKQAETALRQSEERQAFLLKLSDALRPLHDPVEIQNAAVRLLAEQLQVSRAGYYEVEADQNVFFLTARWEREIIPLPDRMLLTDFGDEIREGYRAGRTMIARDTEHDTATDDNLEAVRAIRVRAWIGVPLVKNGRWVAAVGVHSAVPRDWTLAEIRVVEEVAERTWAAVERAHVEGALRQSEELRLVAVESGRMGTWRWDLDEGLIYGDAVFQALWGFDASEQGRPLAHYTDRMTLTGQEEMAAIVARAVAVDEEFDGNLEVADGSTKGRWIRWRGRAEHDRPRFLYGVSFDITEQRLGEERLRDSEARYHALFAASPVPLMVLAANPPDYTIMAANDAYFAATLTTPESLIGRRLFDVFTDDPARPGQLGSEALDISLERVLRTRQTDAMERVRYDIVNPDGGFEPHWWLAINAPLLDAAGNVTAIIHQVDRQTEQHYAEEAERERRERQAFLLKLSDALRPLIDPIEIQATASRLVGAHLGVIRAGHGEVEGDEVVVRTDYSDGVPSMAGRYPLATFGPAIASIYRDGGVAVIRDVTTEDGLSDAERELFHAAGVAAHVTAAIHKSHESSITFGVHSAVPRDWTDSEVSLIQDVAERTWAAVARARAEAALRESQADLAHELTNTKHLQEVSGLLIEHENDEAPYGPILDAAMAIMRSDFASIQVVEPESGDLVLLGHRGFHSDAAKFWKRIATSTSRSCGVALTNGERVIWLATDTDDPDELGHYRLSGIESMQSTPLVSRGGRLIGMMSTYWRAPHSPAEADFRSFDVLVRQTADAFERVRGEQALRESEERLRQFGDASQDVLWIRDAETLQWRYLAPAFEAIYGIDRKDALTGENFSNWLGLILPEDREHAKANIDRVRAGEHVTFEFRIRRPSDGAIRWMRNTDFPIFDEDGRVALIGGIGHDATDLKRLVERQDTLLAELQHRVRNILAVTRSIISRSDDGERSTEDYVQHLQGRIAALARTQVLLTRAAGTSVDLDSLIRDELLAQFASFDQVTIEGVDVALSPKVAEVLTLAIHELATNATKYGAFSRPAGRLDVHWSVERRDSQDWLVFDWTERGVPIVDVAPRRRGFGAELISRRIPYELKGSGSLELRAGGVECHIEFPLTAGESILQTDAGGR